MPLTATHLLVLWGWTAAALRTSFWLLRLFLFGVLTAVAWLEIIERDYPRRTVRGRGRSKACAGGHRRWAAAAPAGRAARHLRLPQLISGRTRCWVFTRVLSTPLHASPHTGRHPERRGAAAA